jgi:hypothetical protein
MSLNFDGSYRDSVRLYYQLYKNVIYNGERESLYAYCFVLIRLCAMTRTRGNMYPVDISMHESFHSVFLKYCSRCSYQNR